MNIPPFCSHIDDMFRKELDFKFKNMLGEVLQYIGIYMFLSKNQILRAVPKAIPAVFQSCIDAHLLIEFANKTNSYFMLDRLGYYVLNRNRLEANELFIDTTQIELEQILSVTERILQDGQELSTVKDRYSLFITRNGVSYAPKNSPMASEAKIVIENSICLEGLYCQTQWEKEEKEKKWEEKIEVLETIRMMRGKF